MYVVGRKDRRATSSLGGGNEGGALYHDIHERAEMGTTDANGAVTIAAVTTTTTGTAWASSVRADIVGILPFCFSAPQATPVIAPSALSVVYLSSAYLSFV